MDNSIKMGQTLSKYTSSLQSIHGVSAEISSLLGGSCHRSVKCSRVWSDSISEGFCKANEEIDYHTTGEPEKGN